MATTELYTNEILVDVMAKVDDCITALNNVNTAVAQTVTALNVKAGTAKNVVINAAEFSFLSGASNDNRAARTMKAMCNGVVIYKGRVKSSQASYPVRLAYSINGGAWVATANIDSTVYVDASMEIPVKFGDTIAIGLQAYAAARTYYLEAGATLNYDLIDIVNEGAFA